MSPGTAIPVAIALTGMAAALGYTVFRLVTYLRQFKHVPGWAKTLYAGPADPKRLGQALDTAVVALCTFTPWTSIALEATINSLTIITMPVTAWRDPWGRKVAGLTQNNWIQVGSDLAALCHEIAHAHELRLTGVTDESHESWKTNGIYKAIGAYEAWSHDN